MTAALRDYLRRERSKVQLRRYRSERRIEAQSLRQARVRDRQPL